MKEDVRIVKQEQRELPLTPPSTLKKDSHSSGIVEYNALDIKPRRLFKELKKTARKPRLKYRPDPCTVFNIDDYFDGLNQNKVGVVENMDFLKYALTYSKKIVVITGAGISVGAGIPDFRSSKGLFSSLKDKTLSSGKELFDYHRVYSSDEMSIKFNDMIKIIHTLSSNTVPTQFHEFINRLALDGRLQRLYTQNIDGLDTRLPHLSTKVPLGKPSPMTIQLHGSIHHMECNKCSHIKDFDPTIFKSNAEDSSDTNIKSQIVPLCPQCEEFESVRSVAGLRLKGVGKLRPRVVLYNEMHPEGDIIGEIANLDLKRKPDCLIIAGTSLNISGVKIMCRQFAEKVRSSKGFIIYVNKEMPAKSVIDTIGHIDLIALGDCQNIPKLLS